MKRYAARAVIPAMVQLVGADTLLRPPFIRAVLKEAAIAVLGQGYLLVREYALHGWSLRRLIGQTTPGRITVLHVQTDASTPLVEDEKVRIDDGIAARKRPFSSIIE